MASKSLNSFEKAKLKIPVLSRVPKTIFWIVLIVIIVTGIGIGAYSLLHKSPPLPLREPSRQLLPAREI
jgi:hypothetical protein